jgi:hypothetical protein
MSNNKFNFFPAVLFGLISVLASIDAARAEQRVQNFDTEPEDWTGFNNRIGFNDFGWSDSDHVGLGAGEAGGGMARDGSETPDFGYYATSVGSIDPSTDAFNFSGTLSFEPPQFDYFQIGYFTSADGIYEGEYYPQNFIGFYSDDRYAAVRHFATNADPIGGGNPRFFKSGPSGPPPAEAQWPLQTPIEFELAYDPDGSGGLGTISGQFGDFEFSYDLPEGKKDAFNNFTEFGLVTRNNHNGGTIIERSTPTYVDNLTYFVPGAEEDLFGDYNDNGTVDAADYVAWRDNEGTTNTLLNRHPDNTGPIGAADYETWAANFGDMAASGSSVAGAAVPEPASLALGTIVGGLALLGRRARRASK